MAENESFDADYTNFDDFQIMTISLFLKDGPFPVGYNTQTAFQDVEMDPEDDSKEESKIANRGKSIHRSSYSPLRNEQDLNPKKWDINLREKLNLNKYTKVQNEGKSILKNQMNEHKETFLPKSYVPFKLSNQQMYKIVKLEELEKIIREINLDQSFEVDYVELLTKYEFPAVLRLKKKFMTWLCKYMHEKIQQKKDDLEEKKLQKEEEERLRKTREEEEADMKARKDYTKSDLVVSNSKQNIFALHDIDDLDPLEDNPSKILD